MTELPLELQLLIAENTARSHDRVREEAARDPERYKTTLVFPRDGHTRYLYWQSKPGPRMREVRFCYSTGRNAAGYFLSWRERDIGRGRWQRDKFVARKRRKAAKEVARRRYRALEQKRGR